MYSCNMKRECKYCGEPLSRNSNETLDRFIDRQYCRKRCFSLYQLTGMTPSYISMYLIGSETPLRVMHGYVSEHIDITYHNMYSNYIMRGISPKLKHGMKVALSIADGLYMENPRHFETNPFDYRRLFRPEGGVWISDDGDLLQSVLENYSIRYVDAIRSLIRRSRSGDKTDPVKAAINLQKSLTSYLAGVESYGSNSLEEGLKVMIKRRDQISPLIARDICRVIKSEGATVDYRCLLNPRKLASYR